MFISKKKWVELETKVNVLLTERNSEIQQLRKENEEFRNVKELLKPVRLKVKKAVYSESSDTVLVEYEAPTVILEFDNGVQLTKNDFLKSLNLLHLISLEDQMKIQKEIKKATERRNNER